MPPPYQRFTDSVSAATHEGMVMFIDCQIHPVESRYVSIRGDLFGQAKIICSPT